MKRGFGWTTSNNNKFGANKVVYKGIEFDSQYERDRYIYLLDRQKKGEISQLRLKSRFMLIPQTVTLIPKQLKTKTKYVERVVEQDADYHNDFTYVEDEVYVSEEFKSEYTAKLQDYVLRRKLMVKKIYAHNSKGRSRWIFREVVYSKDRKVVNIKITDK